MSQKPHLYLFFTLIIFISGCTKTTTKAIDSRNLSTNIKMSDTIFLEPVSPNQQIIWLRIRSSAGQDELNISTINEFSLYLFFESKNPISSQFITF